MTTASPSLLHVARSLTLIGALALAAPTAVADEMPAVPPSLQPWIPWVLHAHKDERCAAVGDERRCDWPGHLTVRIDERGGEFALQVWRDRRGEVALPGGAKLWPQAVTLDGAPATLRANPEGTPSLLLEAGHHQVAGRFDWQRAPEVMPVPAEIGVATLMIDGKPIERIRRDGGRLWLAQGDAVGDGDETDSIRVEVHRQLQDGVPLKITTRFELKVAGRARDEVLGKVLLAGAVPVAMRAGLPAQLGRDGALRVHVRPGAFRIEVDAVHPADSATLTVPSLDNTRFDANEVWLWLPNQQVRSVELSGLTAIDPERTSLAKDWRGGPTFVAHSGEILQLKVTRRGEGEAAPNRMTLQRELWLDLDGTGLTVRDRIRGTMHRDWRIDHGQDGDLGRVRDRAAGRDLLITTKAGHKRPGVEVRSGTLDLEAETRLKGATDFAAVGWDFDAQSLSATLHLPPGWRLLGASGVDSLPGTWLSSWTLFDFFLVLMVALGTGRLLGWRWGALALAALVVSHHESDAPQWVWLHLLASLALVRALPAGWIRNVAWVYRTVAMLALVLMLVPFSIGQVRHGIYPQVKDEGGIFSSDFMSLGAREAVQVSDAEASEDEVPSAPQVERKAYKGALKRSARAMLSSKSDVGSSDRNERLGWQLQQVDPNAVVQTGPGLPNWKWSDWQLRWSGPVRRDHRVELVLLSPLTNLALAILRVLLLVGLGLALLEPRRLSAILSGWMTPPSGRPAIWAAALLSAGVLAHGSARAAPPPPQELDPVPQQIQQQAQQQVQQVQQQLQRQQLQTNAARQADGLTAAADLGAGFRDSAALFPPASLLETLRERLLEAQRCDGPCVVASDVLLKVSGDVASLEIEVHARRAAAWGLPGPLAALPVDKVELDGAVTTQLRRNEAGLLLVRLPAGRHRITATARLTGRTVVTLHLDADALPRRLRFESEQWRIDGLGPEGVPDASVQLSRKAPKGTPNAAGAAEEAELPPWFEVDRELLLGLPWQVRTRVRRLDDSRPQLLKVPLLESEAVISEGARVEEAADGGRVALVSFPRGEAEVSFTSELPVSPEIDLMAPRDRAWTETWSVSCAQMWRCAFTGINPVQRQAEDGSLQPRWQPWPGETLKVAIERPKGAQGQAVTVDRVDYKVAPGQRLLEATLALSVRASQGGWRKIKLPEGAELQKVTLAGKEHNIRPDKGVVNLPLRPGEQRIELRWQQPWERSLAEQMPAVELGGPVANARLTVELGEDRWLLWAAGPRWGPAVLFWSHLFVLLLGAALLGRLRGLPLRTGGWLLLGLGFAQLPVAVLLVVVGFFLAMRWRQGFWRARTEAGHALPFAFSQVGLVILTLFTLACLYAAVHTNLLMDLDMQVSGAGSTEHSLRWYVDRSDGALPQPTLFSLPLLVWRLGMLLWSLWLVWALLSWLPWAWRCFGDGGLWRSLSQGRAPIPPPPAGHAVLPDRPAAPPTGEAQAPSPEDAGPTGPADA